MSIWKIKLTKNNSVTISPPMKTDGKKILGKLLGSSGNHD